MQAAPADWSPTEVKQWAKHCKLVLPKDLKGVDGKVGVEQDWRHDICSVLAMDTSASPPNHPQTLLGMEEDKWTQLLGTKAGPAAHADLLKLAPPSPELADIDSSMPAAPISGWGVQQTPDRALEVRWP